MNDNDTSTVGKVSENVVQMVWSLFHYYIETKLR